MARVDIKTVDDLYNPVWNQAKSAKFDHIDPSSSYDTPTDMSICSAESRYNPGWLTDLIDTGGVYRKEALERLEDLEDLRILQEMRKTPLKFSKFEDFMKEYKPGV